MTNFSEAIKKLESIAKEQPGLLELLDNLVDNNLSPVFVVSSDEYDVLKASLKSEDFTKQDLRSIIGKQFISLFPDETHKDIKSMFRKAKRGRNYSFDYEYKLADDSTKYVSFHCFAFAILSENFLFVQCQDKTEEQIAKIQAKEFLSDLKIANAKLLELSVTDELTSLYNIRYFNERIIEEHSKADRYKYPYSILFIDVDHFKQFNDKYGHLCGDQVLSQIAARISDFVRSNDIVARYGGEEFIILCPHTDEQNGTQTAERLREFIEQTVFHVPGHKKQAAGNITISIGVASYPEHSDNFSEIINMSDSAMYISKSNGRNTVSVHQKKTDS